MINNTLNPKDKDVNFYIAQCLKLKTQTVNLRGYGLTALPNALFDLVWIKSLDISHNNIAELPDDLYKLINLQEIDLSGNEISKYPYVLCRLHSLKKVVYDSYSDEAIHFNIYRETGCAGDIWMAPPKYPFLDLPPEIFDLGIDKVNYFFKKINLKSKGIASNEAKILIVGEAGVGKTSLLKKIKDPKSELPKEEDTTHGVDIDFYTFNISQNETFRANIWDFGGQEIYHATHQFFLTNRSVYILVDDARREMTRFLYWMQIINLYSGNSPVIILQNKKANRHSDIDLQGLRQIYNNIHSTIFRIDLRLKTIADLKTMIDFRKELEHQLSILEHSKTQIPIEWYNVKEQIHEIKSSHRHLTYYQFKDICESNNLKDDEVITIGKYFHDIGLFLFFQDDPILRRLIILQNDWATQGVYTLLDNQKIKKKNGFFTRDEAIEIWDIIDKTTEFKGYDVELIQLMKKFELCYSIPHNENLFVAPNLFSIEKPKYKWDDNNNLILYYEYDFMPKGLLSRITVRLHKYIENVNFLTWKYGVILKRENSRAEIIELYNHRQIRIKVGGEDKKILMTIITEEIDEINKYFEQRILIKKMVPCNCFHCLDLISKGLLPNFYKYTDLQQRIQRKKMTIECGNSYEDVVVIHLIENFYYNDIRALILDKKKLFDLIAKGKIEECVTSILYFLKKRKEYNDTYKEVLLLSSQFEKAEKDKNKGVITYQEASIVSNKICNSLIELIDSL